MNSTSISQLAAMLVLTSVASCTGIAAIDSRLTRKVDDVVTAPLAPLSTNLDDTRPTTPWLDVLRPEIRAHHHDVAGNLLPARFEYGYTKVVVQSFCLHAGRPAASYGTGYGLAPFKGMRASVLSHVIERSSQHPEIAQYDVQLLLWSIEVGMEYDQLPSDKRWEYQRLLDASDLARMSSEASALRRTTGSWLGEMSGQRPLFEQGLVDSSVPFAKLESIAVPAGNMDRGPSKWTFVGDGLYVRARSLGYRRTELELYRPAPVRFERDAQHRITAIVTPSLRIEMRNERQRGVGIALIDLGTRDETFIPETVLARRPRRHATTSAMLQYPGEHVVEDALEVYEKYEDIDTAYDALHGTIEHEHQPQDPASIHDRAADAFQELQSWKHAAEMLHAASDPTDILGRAVAMRDHLYAVTDIGAYVVCALRGECTEDDGHGHDAALATSMVAVPYNDGAQRLGLSPYVGD